METEVDTIAEPEPAEAPTTQDPLVGTLVDERYQVDAVLGDGGMGVVYSARHVHLGRPIALKVLKPALVSSKRSLQRFEREAMAATRLTHHHIASTLDFGRLPNGAPYIAMELVSGRPLEDLVQDGAAVDAKRALGIARQIVAALAAAHEAGVVHRDLKPENIQLSVKGTGGDHVKILDFGIAKVSGVSQLTATGHIVGTPLYMAPEQCKGEAVDGRADIYSFGVILYELLTGRRPFDGDLSELLRHHLTTTPDPPSAHARVPRELDSLVLRCLRKDPADRFQTADELDAALARALELVTNGPRDTLLTLGPAEAKRRRRRRYVGALVIGAVALSSVGLVAAFGAESDVEDAAGPPMVEEPSAAQAAVDPRPVDDEITEAETLATARPTIQIETDPPGATLWADGALVGNAPVTMPLPETVIEVEVRARGFTPMTASVGPSSEPTLRLTLTPVVARRGSAMANLHARMTPAITMEPEVTATPPPDTRTMMARGERNLGLLSPEGWD